MIEKKVKFEGTSTGSAFSRHLLVLAEKNANLRVLDADLEKPCKLTDFALKYPDQFIETGISEQDMVSYAGGLALRGRLPVVNTYAAFYRRCFEQIYVNATEHSKIIYAAHYAGMCYTTDGKTHQISGDIAMMRSLPGLLVYYPAFPEEITHLLDWYQTKITDKALYIRLHRTPSYTGQSLPENYSFTPDQGIKIFSCDADACILSSGPQMCGFCTEAARDLSEEGNPACDVYAVSCLNNLNEKFTKEICSKYKIIFIIEENYINGGLMDEFCGRLASLLDQGRIKTFPRLHHKAVDELSFSTRNPYGLYRYFKLDSASLVNYLRPRLKPD